MLCLGGGLFRIKGAADGAIVAGEHEQETGMLAQQTVIFGRETECGIDERFGEVELVGRLLGGQPSRVRTPHNRVHSGADRVENAHKGVLQPLIAVQGHIEAAQGHHGDEGESGDEAVGEHRSAAGRLRLAPAHIIKAKAEEAGDHFQKPVAPPVPRALKIRPQTLGRIRLIGDRFVRIHQKAQGGRKGRVRRALGDDGDDAIALAHGLEGGDLLVHPFGRRRMGRAEHDEPVRAGQGRADALGQMAAGGQVFPVPENGAQAGPGAAFRHQGFGHPVLLQAAVQPVGHRPVLMRIAEKRQEARGLPRRLRLCHPSSPPCDRAAHPSAGTAPPLGCCWWAVHLKSGAVTRLRRRAGWAVRYGSSTPLERAAERLCARGVKRHGEPVCRTTEEDPTMTLTRRQTLVLPAAALGSALIAAPTLALAARKPDIFLQSGGIFSSAWTHALNGHDTVAYFTEGRPMPGDPRFETSYLGAKWLFISQENLDTFLEDPDAYRPQYGGYCAYALAAKKQLIKGDPEAWHIHDNRLFLNYDTGTAKRWLKDKENYIAAADSLWPAILES